MALISAQITADVIEVSEFPAVAQRYQVMGVPKTVINERIGIDGAVPAGHFVQKVVEAAAPQNGSEAE